VNPSTDQHSLPATIAALQERLLAARGPRGYWEGRLSSSALATATAVFALAVADRETYSALVDRGLQWLCRNQNADGGWGDTVQSPSNLSTTMLCYSALAIADFGLRIPDSELESSPAANPQFAIRNPQWAHTVCQAESWLHHEVGSLEPQALAKAVERQYGKDRTFSVPILTMCALAGRLGPGAQAWRMVRPLPFELAVLPHRLYKWLRLPVVSYALPALIAIGQARYEHRKPRNPLTATLRHLSRAKSFAVLTRLQPENGGFLEAAPLTSFVVMSLAASGHRDHEVVSKGVKFLAASIREDGSWPIDTNLATWATTLSINALADCGLNGPLQIRNPQSEIRNQSVEWLLSCQHREVHPYTHAEPGGWAWSNLPGAVPDGDDTAGALIALHELSSRRDDDALIKAASVGINWLLGLQNSDGGIPTFCRGWTKLPFDKSSPDITAHALGAMGAWLDALPSALRSRTEKAMEQAVRYLQDAQRTDGSWVPLWFGNQHAPNQENPVYGTSRALTHLSRLPEPYVSPITAMRDKAVRWLLSVQNADGGWGGAGSVVSSIEETALAVDGLCTVLLQSAIPNPQSAIEAVRRGAEWLMRNTDRGRSTPASPIGLYFARLWYFDELYPVIFALSALGKVSRLLDHPVVP
jgi:squalene-hopene/tetraprenyl-beta-curcumene cyclase